ncbi:toxin YdaT domain-containing protein [Klebsiella aerogenes]
MQSLTYQHNTVFVPTAMINRAQTKQDHDHELIRDAVRAWASAIDNQDVVSALIINEYREQGGDSISFPDDISRARQKLFRFLDNRFDSEQYRENVRQLTPAIMAVLPLEFRTKLAPQNDTMSLIASAMKECAEAKQAVLLNAPEHQKLKEVSEGIASLFRLMPEQVGPLMTMVTSMLGVM